MRKRMKYLKADDYFTYFATCPPGHGLTVQQEPSTGEVFLNFSTIVPIQFLLEGTNLPLYVTSSLPSKVEINFELIGRGKAEDRLCAIFKPWIVGLSNDYLLLALENFFLYMNDSYYSCLIEQAVFLEKITYFNIERVQVAQDKITDAYQFFGLNSVSRTKEIMTSRLKIQKVNQSEANKILSFYRENWSSLSLDMSEMYFRENLNIWYQLSTESEDEPVGYIRLYTELSSFRFGPFIEYILQKNKRGQGLMKEAIGKILELIKIESTALYLFAEVEEANVSSIAVLRNTGFSEIQTPFSSKKNYSYSITDNWQVEQEAAYVNDTMRFGYLNKYHDNIQNYL